MLFGLTLSLPEHVQVNLDPNPKDGGKTYLLVITGRMAPDAKEFSLQKPIPRDVKALDFGRDLLNAINHIYGLARQHAASKQQQG